MVVATIGSAVSAAAAGKRVVFACDGAEAARIILHYAIEIAAKKGTGLIIDRAFGRLSLPSGGVLVVRDVDSMGDLQGQEWDAGNPPATSSPLAPWIRPRPTQDSEP